MAVTVCDGICTIQAEAGEEEVVEKEEEAEAGARTKEARVVEGEEAEGVEVGGGGEAKE